MMLPCSDEVRHMTDESIAPFHRNPKGLPRKQRQHECSSKANRKLIERNPPSSSSEIDLESLHQTLLLGMEFDKDWFEDHEEGMLWIRGKHGARMAQELENLDEKAASFKTDSRPLRSRTEGESVKTTDYISLDQIHASPKLSPMPCRLEAGFSGVGRWNSYDFLAICHDIFTL
ncbi:unnamed protein product [Protopolystoma xenopodis]|uniref:Uncharacterized protein n=1 Tax=Protopolystoma xenopodis TaxID=117903 RepID=A0A448WIB0_9PLAT|nr:unnamed protein product [Protopolystoma xenopodis]